RPSLDSNLLLALEQGAPEAARLVAAVGPPLVAARDLHDRRRRRLLDLGLAARRHGPRRRLDAVGRRPKVGHGERARLRLERLLALLELARVLLAEQLAHELAQLLRIEPVAGDQSVEIGGELCGVLVAVGDIARERFEADRIELGRDAAVEV